MENRKQANKKSIKEITNEHIDIEIVLSPNFCFHSFFFERRGGVGGKGDYIINLY